MQFPTYSIQGYIARLAALVAASYPIGVNASKVRLYVNDFTPDANMDIGMFVEATYADYEPLTVNMSSPSINDQGMIVSRSGMLQWATPPGVDPVTVYGIYITEASGTDIIAAQRFDSPQQLGGNLPQAIAGVWRTSEPLTSLGWINIEGG